uniref:Uncharacterized protein n=1 Tax=Anguilla anguilla TaxID=7936 RepID=A0A0E9R8S6_ANGAN
MKSFIVPCVDFIRLSSQMLQSSLFRLAECHCTGECPEVLKYGMPWNRCGVALSPSGYAVLQS